MSIFIPGRIEFLGKHTDYCGGRSLVCAIDRGFEVQVEPIRSRSVELFNRDTRSGASISLDDPSAATGPKWILYPRTVVERVAGNFVSRELQGVRISFRSTLPGASGLSSSSALVTAVFLALDEVNGLRGFDEFKSNIPDDLALAEYLGCIENGESHKGLAGSKGVGTFGGSQDHTAILCSRKGHFGLFSFRPVRREADIRLPEDHCFVIASSGVKAAKTGGAREKFNRVSRMVSVITDAWPGGRSLAELIVDEGIDAVEKHVSDSDLGFETRELIDRVRQFYCENFTVIGQVSDLLSAGQIDRIGGLIDISQRNAERYLGNQTEETIVLQRTARELGAAAASAFGAGFGGSVYALVRREAAEEFTGHWRKKFHSRYPGLGRYSSFFRTESSQIDLHRP